MVLLFSVINSFRRYLIVCVFNKDTRVYITDLVSQALLYFIVLLTNESSCSIAKFSLVYLVKIDEYVPSPFTAYSIQDLLIKIKIRIWNTTTPNHSYFYS